MRMLLPLKYAMILAPSMLSYSYIIDHVRLILCFRELEREEREDKQCYGAAGGASKLSQQQQAVGETTQEGGHIRARLYLYTKGHSTIQGRYGCKAPFESYFENLDRKNLTVIVSHPNGIKL